MGNTCYNINPNALNLEPGEAPIQQYKTGD